MKIQVCRQCGNRNTVVSKALKNCNYCGSSDLEDISFTESDEAVAQKASSSSLKWVILFFITILIVGIGFWAWQNFLQNNTDINNKTSGPSFLKDISSSNTNSEKSSDSTKLTDSEANNELQDEIEQSSRALSSIDKEKNDNHDTIALANQADLAADDEALSVTSKPSVKGRLPSEDGEQQQPVSIDTASNLGGVAKPE